MLFRSIPRNTTLPVRVGRKYRTQKVNQKSLLVQIVEGESPSPDNCTFIGSCKIPNLPPNLPAGTPVYVMFEYLPDGRLRVGVEIPDANEKVTQEFTRENNLSKTLLDGWRQYISNEPPTDYQ